METSYFISSQTKYFRKMHYRSWYLFHKTSNSFWLTLVWPRIANHAEKPRAASPGANFLPAPCFPSQPSWAGGTCPGTGGTHLWWVGAVRQPLCWCTGFLERAGGLHLEDPWSCPLSRSYSHLVETPFLRIHVFWLSRWWLLHEQGGHVRKHLKETCTISSGSKHSSLWRDGRQDPLTSAFPADGFCTFCSVTYRINFSNSFTKISLCLWSAVNCSE